MQDAVTIALVIVLMEARAKVNSEGQRARVNGMG